MNSEFSLALGGNPKTLIFSPRHPSPLLPRLVLLSFCMVHGDSLLQGAGLPGPSDLVPCPLMPLPSPPPSNALASCFPEPLCTEPFCARPAASLSPPHLQLCPLRFLAFLLQTRLCSGMLKHPSFPSAVGFMCSSGSPGCFGDEQNRGHLRATAESLK